MSELNGRLAYVVGDCYENLTRLSGVMTASQFFKEVFDGSLPLNFTWMLGQGLNSVEENLLRLCKMHQPEIRFYGDSVLETPDIVQHTFFTKLSKLMKAMITHLGLAR